jgi:hypothetical protein
VFKNIAIPRETAVCFDVPRKYTVDAKTAKNLKMKTTDYEK